ncbi:MAG: hypothetical protein ACYDH6_08380 [Acidimicrobiales bacterium]
MSVVRAGTREVIHGRVEPGPVFVVGAHRIPWDKFGEACVGAELEVTYDSPPEGPSEDLIDAVALLAQSLPRAVRGACPRAALAAACDAARLTDDLLDLVGGVVGWEEELPADDEELWTGAAMAFASIETLDPADWLAAIIELVRCGPGTLADPDSLVALAARCLDVDSAAADPKAAPSLRAEFAAVMPVWRALEAVDASGALTALGAWGIPEALARQWGGSLEP